MFDIKRDYMWSKLKVGIVITLAILILITTTFFAGGIEKLFSPTVKINIHFKDVKGLRKGSPVWFSGIEIGSVKDINLHAEYGTIVTVSIKKDAATFIKKDSTAIIQTIGLLGDKYIEIGIGSAEEKAIKEGDTLKGLQQLDVKDILKAGINTFSKISELADGLERLIKKFEITSSVISNSKFFTNPTLYDNINETARTLTLILNDFRESEGALKKLINDPTLYDKVVSATSSIDEFGKRVNQNEGSLKKLIDDPSLYENLNTASKELSLILQKIESGDGLAGTLIKDEKLDEEFKETLSELKKLTTDLRELTKDIKANPKKYFKFSIF